MCVNYVTFQVHSNISKNHSSLTPYVTLGYHHIILCYRGMPSLQTEDYSYFSFMPIMSQSSKQSTAFEPSQLFYAATHETFLIYNFIKWDMGKWSWNVAKLLYSKRRATHVKRNVGYCATT